MPTAREITTAWERLKALHRDDPGDRRVAGAYAAAAWTSGRAEAGPITGTELPPVGQVLAEEPHYALMVVEGIMPGDRDYAVGAAAWLFWYRDQERLPGWLAQAMTSASESPAEVPAAGSGGV